MLGSPSGKKKDPKPKLFGPDICGWGGGLPREGQKVRYVLRSPGKPKFPNFLAGDPGIFAGISQGRPKSLRKKVCVQFNSVHTRCIVKTSGFTRGVCKNR